MDVNFFNIIQAYFVHVAVICISFPLIYLLYAANHRGNLPPGRRGLPFFGETLDLALASRRGRPEKFFSDRMKRHSPDVFRTSLLRADVAVFCGAAGNKFLFSGQNKYVSSWWPESMMKVLLGPSSTRASEEGNRTRSYVPSFLSPESLQKYVPVMDAMAKDHLDREWSPFEQVKVFPLSKKYTFQLAGRLFMSVEDETELAAIEEPFRLATAGMMSAPVNLPGTAFSRAVRGGEMIREKLVAIIRRKREQLAGKESSGVVVTDLASSMLVDGLTEIEVAHQMVGVLLASYDTTSTAITFIISYLADYPHVYQKVLEEQREILKGKGGGELLNWRDIQRMKYTWCVACEVMRLTPPINGGFKEAISDFTYAGYTIPKGWKAFWSVHTTHKKPEYFPEPDKFDPSRFEGSGPPPFTFVPFGGGPRMCPGREYARLEILTFIHNVVTRFRWEKVDPNERISYTGSPIPCQGLPITLKLNSPAA